MGVVKVQLHMILTYEIAKTFYLTCCFISKSHVSVSYIQKCEPLGKRRGKVQTDGIHFGTSMQACI